MARPIKYTPSKINELIEFSNKHDISLKSACTHKGYHYESFIRAKNKYAHEKTFNRLIKLVQRPA